MIMKKTTPLPRADEWATVEGDDGVLLADLLEQATNDTDALLAELLGEEPAAATTSGEQIAETVPRQSETTTLRIDRPVKGYQVRKSKAKHTLECLRREVSQLSTTLKRLESECNIPQPHIRAAMETATVERLKRRRVEDECKQLRAAVFTQTQFLRGLRSVFSTPMALSAMDLTHYLHNYTRLPRDRSTRWSEYASLAKEARLQSAMDILCRETQKMRVADEGTGGLAMVGSCVRPSVQAPLIQTEVLHHARQGGFGVTSTSVFALETADLSAVLRGVCVAARDIMAKSQCYECTSLKRQIVDPDVVSGSSSYSNILVRLAGVEDSSQQDVHELSIESRVVTLIKQTDEYAVLMWDFVDDDELHPKKETTDITRQAVGACLIRRETCEDGVERAVCRAMRTRHYRFHEHASTAVLRRFESVIASMMRVSDMVFRGIVMDSIAQEEAAYAQALSQMQAVAPTS